MLRARHAPATRPHDRRPCASNPCSKDDQIMAEDEGAADTNEPAGNGNDSLPQVGVLAQYVKDLSFENPNAPAVYQWQSQPQMDVQFNIGTQTAGHDIHEVSLKIDITAKADEGTAFRIELLYAGLFALRNIPAEQLQPFLLAEAPRHAVPVRPQDHRRRGDRGRLPAACGSTRSTSPASTCRAPPSSRPKRPAARPGT